METVYLDNSATTLVCARSRERMLDALDHVGNPSSLHFEGVRARRIINEARSALLEALGVRPTPAPEYKVIFTSCGTESNDLALRGVLTAKNRKFIPRVITANSEHPSVLETLTCLEKEGKAEIIKLSTKGGAIDEGELKNALNERTVLVSIMTVNNETGAVYDIKKLFSLVKSVNPAIITHTDMTQGFMKIKLSGGIPALKADAVTVSGHKIHAPKGVAALIVKSDLVKRGQISPILRGGGQEEGMRSGTENLPGIAALHGAIEECKAALDSGFEERISNLRGRFVAALPDEVTINQPKSFAPHIISLTMPRIKSQTTLSFLSSKGICVSSGSACSSHKNTGSYVLAAYGLTPAEADSTVRISLSVYTTAEELDAAAAAITEGCRTLVRF